MASAPASPPPTHDAARRRRPGRKMAAERQSAGGGGGGRGGAGGGGGGGGGGAEENKENERPVGLQAGSLGDSLGLESILRGGGGTWQARPRGRRGDVAAAVGSAGACRPRAGGHGRLCFPAGEGRARRRRLPCPFAEGGGSAQAAGTRASGGSRAVSRGLGAPEVPGDVGVSVSVRRPGLTLAVPGGEGLTWMKPEFAAFPSETRDSCRQPSKQNSALGCVL